MNIDFDFPSSRKRCFSSFLLIRDLGKLVFSILGLSKPSDASFFSLLINLRPRIAHFFYFEAFRGLGCVVFVIFA